MSQLSPRDSAAPTLPHRHDLAPNFTAPPDKMPPRALQLEIVVGGHCPVCQANLPMIDALRRELPHVDIRVIDVDAPGSHPPKNVIAIPSFLLNGYLVATGNPNLDELKSFIRTLSN
ncbi:MAG: thioredoxin family protein [Chloroflexi bacterium]|nr:thioredoxin family protein [Chloroflexota bacterium]